MTQLTIIGVEPLHLKQAQPHGPDVITQKNAAFMIAAGPDRRFTPEALIGSDPAQQTFAQPRFCLNVQPPPRP